MIKKRFKTVVLKNFHMDGNNSHTDVKTLYDDLVDTCMDYLGII